MFFASLPSPGKNPPGREGSDHELGILEQSQKGANTTGLATGLLLCTSAAKGSDLTHLKLYLVWRWWGIKVKRNLDWVQILIYKI